jgi:hypothetical protein
VTALLIELVTVMVMVTQLVTVLSVMDSELESALLVLELFILVPLSRIL